MIAIAARCASAGMVGMALALTVSAQEAPSGQSGVLQEVVVTAQRRVENLQTVPIAATAIAGDQLQSKAVQRLADLQFAAPSLQITDSGGLVQNVNIRGIGLASGSPQVTNGVATYVDGLFQPPIVTTNRFYDIANVEVLRGPQGTLAGANSTGGAIFITSRNPQFEGHDGHLEVEGGNAGTRGAQAAVNLPVTDTFAMRAAGLYSKHDNYSNDLGPFNNHPGRQDEVSGRLSALWKPGNYQALAKFEVTDRSTGGVAYRPLPTTPFAPFAAPGNIRNVDYNTTTVNHEHALASSIEQRYQADNGIAYRLLSGYQDKKVNNLFDVDATEADDQTLRQFVREREHSEEINVISPTTGPLTWILGGYYQQNKIDVKILQLGGPVPVNVDPQNKKTTTGLFFQTNYSLTQRLELQVGARYSHFEASGVGGVFIGRGVPGFPPEGLQVGDTNGQHTDGRMSGKVDLNFELDDNNLLYAFVARGSKPGGFNSSTSQFGPEGVWDYEAGWKSTLADGHVRTQLGGFFYRYSDFQFDVVDLSNGQTGTKNLPQATIKGLEGQLQAALGAVRLDAGFAFVDSRLSSITFVNSRLLPTNLGTLGPQCPPGTPSSPPTCFDYAPYLQTNSGGPNLYSPKWTYNIGAEYLIPVGRYSLSPRLNYAYVGPSYTTLFYSPITDRLASRGLLSALLIFRANAWTVEGFATNLTDKVYVTGQANNAAFYGPPRQYGVRVGWDF